MARNPSIGYILTVLVITNFPGCDIDHGLKVDDPTEVVRHGIRGQVTFDGPWPQDIAELRLVASNSFPPDPDSLIRSDPFDPRLFPTELLNYELPLSPGTYRFLALIFREKDRTWNISNIFGVFSQQPTEVLGLLFPDSVSVDSDTTIVDDVDIEVDLTKGSISGSVNFSGNWPEEIIIAGIGVFERPVVVSPDPLPLLSLLDIQGVSILPSEVSRVGYRVRVPPGTYRGINVMVLVSLDPPDIRTIGRFESQNPSGNGIVVTTSEDTPRVDLQADWRILSENQ